MVLYSCEFHKEQHKTCLINNHINKELGSISEEKLILC